uniref:Abnormal spindle-like microcephaly-associated protein ASH domain-containing protein n=1 Tax=Strigamia maritima TaxID=126957 RepID=T1IHJ5_STRMM
MMDDSSLGILLPDEMNLDSFGTSVNEDDFPSRRESRSSREELQNKQQTDADLLSPLNYEFVNDDDDKEIDFTEFGLNEDELALITGDISDMDCGDDDSDDDKEDMWINDNNFGMTKNILDPSTSNIGFQPGKGSPASSDVDTDTELQAIYRQNPSQYPLHRPDLEGNSSAAPTGTNTDLLPRLDLRESAEGSVVSSPVNGNNGDGGGGDGSSGHSDDDLALNILSTRNSEVRLQSRERICPQGIENSEFLLPQIFFQPTHNRPSESYCIKPWGDDSSLRIDNFQSREMNCRADGSDTTEFTPVVFSTDQISARSSSLPDSRSANTAIYSSLNNHETFKLTSDATASSSRVSTQNMSSAVQNLESSLPKTELAFYTDLRNEFIQKDFMTDGEIDFGGVNEDFVNAADAMEMLNRDEKQFEENPFQQDGANSFSKSMNWMNKDNLDITRPSWMSDVSHDRVSIGRFLGSKTNPLGSLGGSKNATERPAFGGNAIVSPRNSIYEDSSTLTKNRNRDQTSEANRHPNETNSVVSISFIEKFIQDASISTDSNTLAEQVFKVAKQMKKQKKQALKSLEESSISSPKIEKSSGRKRTNFDLASTSKTNAGNLEMLQDWEPLRPSSAFQSRPSGYHSPIAASRKTRFSVGFEDRFKKPCDMETPSVLIPKEKNKFPTSTPYCGNLSFPINLSDSSWPSHIENDPTPKSRFNRIEPRTILTNHENTMTGVQPVENFDERNVDLDADKTLTETNAFEIHRRLSGGQDTRLKNSEKLVVAMPPEQIQLKKNSMQQVNLFNYKLENQSGGKSAEFFPLMHNTLRDCDQSSVRTPEISHIKKSFVQLPPLKKDVVRDSYQGGLGTSTQFRDCDTVSLQRTASIRVSSELKFEEVACVGIGCEAFLPIQNLTSRWLKCNFQLVNLILDGQSLPTEISPFIFKHETIIEPNSIDKFQVIYASRVPGAVRAELQVTAQPIVPNKPGQNESSVSQIILTAEAEHPNIDVLLDDKRLVDFGTLAEDSCTEINFGMVNVGPASVPIRLVIQSTNKPWQGFYFSKKNLNSESPVLRSLRSSNVISFKMPGQSVGTNTPRVFNTLLAFRAPTLDANARESIMSMSAMLNVEVDIPGNSTVVLHSIPLKARIGTVHVETLKDLEPVMLHSTGGKPAKCKIPLRNSGSIPLILEATISHSPRLFVITPHSLQIPPGQESDITITFIPQADVQKISSVLQLTLYPGGPAYEIQLTAEVVTSVSVLKLESSKHFLVWGGISVGSSQDQTLLLRNSCQLREPCEVQISVRGATEDYWLITPNGAAQSINCTIVSQEEIPICVKFAPTSAKHSAGKVVIKPTSILSNNKQIRYVIPLVGYGGRSKLELIGLQQNKLGIYTVPVEQSGSASSTHYSFVVKNIGEWAAFVKVIPSSENNDGIKPSLQSVGKAPPDFVVSPNEFVVGKQKSMKINVVIRLPEKSYASPNVGHNGCVGAMTILYGDEISRKRFRALKNQPPQYTTNSNQSINFDVRYHDEDIANEEDMPPTPIDVQLFYNGINHCQLQLVSVSAEKRTNLESWMVDSRPVVNASPPVRELQMRSPKRLQKNWEILPKHITFNVRRSDPKSCLVQSIYLQNKSNKSLRFYFVWPGYLFTIIPATGMLKPRELLKVDVTLIPSELSEWEGKISAKCDELEEEIKVDVKCTNVSAFPTEKLMSPVKIMIKKISFPLTVVNTSSEFPMEMQNSQVSPQQWILSSVNPAVVKTKNGEIKQVSYSAFRFTKMSGLLKADEVFLVPVTFFPLEEGEFDQEWDLVTKDSAKNVHRVTLRLLGEGISKSKKDSVTRFQISPCKKQTRSQSLNVYHQKRELIQLSANVIEFLPISVHKCSRLTVQINNISQEDHICQIIPPKPPFFVNHSRLRIKRRRFVKLPVNFKSTEAGKFKDVLKLETDLNQMLEVRLWGIATQE